MKMIIFNDKAEKRLGIYSKALLYIFITLLVAQTLIVTIKPGLYVKEAVVQAESCNPYCESPDQGYGYERISVEEISDLKNDQLYINILGLVGIIGWCVFNPDFRKGFKDKIDWMKKNVN